MMWEGSYDRLFVPSGSNTMAELVTTEMGCPITQSRATHAQRPRPILDSMIEIGRTCPFTEVRIADSGRARVTREPGSTSVSCAVACCGAARRTRAASRRRSCWTTPIWTRRSRRCGSARSATPVR